MAARLALSLRHKILTRLSDANENFEQISGKFGKITSADITDGSLGIVDLAVGIVLELASPGTARKVNFGSGTWASTASATGTMTVTHGLGTASIFPLAIASDGLVVMAVDTFTTTTFRAWFRYADGVARTASGPFYWLAVA